MVRQDETFSGILYGKTVSSLRVIVYLCWAVMNAWSLAIGKKGAQREGREDWRVEVEVEEDA